ncbi:nucleoside deaminase [Methanocrinis sp.]|uniref:nucleoside deaminase n=1 Tax=Methanocrinis sp. TaxID=3101522 RepID=UPI003D0AD32E
MMKSDEKFMRAAILEAKEGLAEGGVPIGAVLVEEGSIIGRGRNRRVQDSDQLMHAEIDCLRDARLTGGYMGTTLYSTMMPCYLCAGAAVQFGIKRVVAGEAESAPEARKFMESHGIEVENLDLAECKELLAEFILSYPGLWDQFLAECNPEIF